MPCGSWARDASDYLRRRKIPAINAFPLALAVDAALRGEMQTEPTTARGNSAEARSRGQKSARDSREVAVDADLARMWGVEGLLQDPEPVAYRDALLSAVRGNRVAPAEHGYWSRFRADDSLGFLRELSSRWGQEPLEKATMIRNNGFAPGLKLELLLRDEVIEVAGFLAVTESRLEGYVDRVASASYPDDTSTARFSSHKDWENLLFEGRDVSLLAAYHGNLIATNHLAKSLESAGSRVAVADVLSHIAPTTRGGMVLS